MAYGAWAVDQSSPNALEGADPKENTAVDRSKRFRDRCPLVTGRREGHASWVDACPGITTQTRIITSSGPGRTWPCSTVARLGRVKLSTRA